LKLKLFILNTGRLCWVADWFHLYDLYCRPKQCRCIGQTPCSLERYLVFALIFGKNIPDTTGHQTTVEVPTSPNVCFCTT